MPFNKVMHKFKHGLLHSGSSKGPKVKDRKQAIAIMLSEKKKADEGDSEYASDEPVVSKKKKKNKISTGPSSGFMSKLSKGM